MSQTFLHESAEHATKMTSNESGKPWTGHGQIVIILLYSNPAAVATHGNGTNLQPTAPNSDAKDGRLEVIPPLV